MKLVPCTEDDLRLVRAKTDIWMVLTEFADSDYDVVEVSDYTHKDAHSCAASINTSIKRFGFAMSVMVRRGRVFLLKNK